MSPSSARPWTTIATIVASDRISCSGQQVGAPRRRSSLVLISRPSETARLASTRATIPAARLVIQNRWGVALVVMGSIVGALEP